jgi:hypothetical protein
MDQYHDIEFAEIEFQPQSVRQAFPGAQPDGNEEIELGRIVNADHRTLRRLVRASKLVGESTLEKLRREAGSSERTEGTETLIRTRSGVSSRLETVKELDESSDLEAQSLAKRALEKEIV